MAQLIFLSHIHEEKELAQIIQTAIEEEFAGFVEVFVSSDGKSIPAGANLLNVIEEGLVNCVAAIYLISPYSLKRNWINFELGAVWIRNVTSLSKKKAAIPTIPICHSGAKVSALPAPLSHLNAIQGNLSASLEFAFTSIQTAVGGRGRLKCDFVQLASQVKKFEDQYTIGDNLIKFFKICRNAITPTILQPLYFSLLTLQAKALGRDKRTPISQVGFKEEDFKALKAIQETGLSEYITLNFLKSDLVYKYTDPENPDISNATTYIKVTADFSIDTNLLLDYEEIITNELS